MSRTDDLAKIIVHLPDDDRATHESFWAAPLGHDRYELRNSPFLAYDLHFMDIVKAVRDSADELPRITEVVKRSGHSTLRVLFAEEVAEADQMNCLEQLGQLGTSHERADRRLVALDVPPHADCQAVVDQLSVWEANGILHYETGATSQGK